MRDLPLRRALALLWLGLWTVPGFAAVALGLHLAESHRGGGHHGSSLVEELALVAVHGHHHHEVTVPDHDHPASPDSAGDARLNTISVALTPDAAAAAPASQDRGATPGFRHRRGPPDPLFYTHCSLLL